MKNIKKFIPAVAVAIILIVLYFSINGLFAAKVIKEITIPEGTSANSVISMLKEEGLIKSEFMMKLVIKLSGSAGKINSGSAEISSKMGYLEIKDKLLNANSIVKVTIPEGYELDQIVKLFSEKMGLDEGEF